MNLEKRTAFTLRAGIVVGTMLMIVGLCMSMYGAENSVLYAGVLVLILSPFLGVLTSFAALLIQKDYFWAGIAAVLIIITAIGMLIHV